MKLFNIQFSSKGEGNTSTFPALRLPTRKINELSKSGETYYFQEYNMYKGKHLHIGVEVAGAYSVRLKEYPKSTFIRSLNDENLWYMQSGDAEFGLNVCGQFEIEAYNVDRHLIACKKLIVTPVTMTLHQYERMQAEVQDLLLAFNTQPHESDGVTKTGPTHSFPLDDLYDLVNQFKHTLNTIVDSPAEVLTRTPGKSTKNQIKRWTPRTMAAYQAGVGQPKINVEIVEASHDIIEHQMIRTMVDTILSFLRNTLRVELGRKELLENEKEERDSLSPSQSEYSVIVCNMQKKLLDVMNRLSIAEQKINHLNEMIDSLQPFTDSTSLFDVSPIEVEGTHLFLHEPRYRETFECFEDIIALTPKFTIEKQQFVESMIRSPYLFEIWTLLQIYAECIRLRFLPAESITGLLFNWYNTYGTLRNLRIIFEHLDTKDCIAIDYEPNLQSNEGNDRRPDYLVSFYNRMKDSIVRHTLDAKYKPYGMPITKIKIKTDLERSCARYYVDFKYTRYEIASATLAHSSSSLNIFNWNIKPIEISINPPRDCSKLQSKIINEHNEDKTPHRYSHFNIAPGQTHHLSTYMKRIIHQYNGNIGYCPSCGMIVRGIDERYKRTYICTCQEVWVDNVCKFKKDCPDHLIYMRLLKYAHGNYNKQVENNWDVHCQVCGKNFHGEVYETDVLGRKIT